MYLSVHVNSNALQLQSLRPSNEPWRISLDPQAKLSHPLGWISDEASYGHRLSLWARQRFLTQICANTTCIHVVCDQKRNHHLTWFRPGGTKAETVSRQGRYSSFKIVCDRRIEEKIILILIFIN